MKLDKERQTSFIKSISNELKSEKFKFTDEIDLVKLNKYQLKKLPKLVISNKVQSRNPDYVMIHFKRMDDGRHVKPYPTYKGNAKDLKIGYEFQLRKI